MSFWTRWPVKKASQQDAAASRQAAEFVDSLPDDPNKPGYKQSAIPVYEGTIGPVDRTQYKMGHVNTADLKTRQPYVEGDRIKNFDRSKLPQDDTAHPLVVVTRDGQQVVDNGNHRVNHMIATGMKRTPARIVHEIHGYGDQGPGSTP